MGLLRALNFKNYVIIIKGLFKTWKPGFYKQMKRFINIDDLYISQPDSGEQALEIADSLIRSGAMDMIVVDSVAALVPKAEAEGAMGDAHMALQVSKIIAY